MKAEQHSLLTMLLNSKLSFPFFMRYVFPAGYRGKWVDAPHTWKWAELMQTHNKIGLLSARKHLKSTTLYAFLMWKLLHLNTNLEILYLSYNMDMAQYHTRKLKEFIQQNPYFDTCNELTDAASKLNYEKNGFKFVVEPAGMDSFKRGRHPDIVICDDILADPVNMLNLNTIDTITKTFFEQVMSLPKEGSGIIFLFGTPQTATDLFFRIKEHTDFAYSENRAIINEKDKTVLWKELFSYERLCQIRDKELGEKAFNKEYMCSPVYSEEAFFTKKQILSVINSQLKNGISKPNYPVDTLIAGVDVGKHTHPSHLSIFAKRSSDKKMIMLYEQFFDGMEYIEQIKKIKEVVNTIGVDAVYFDNTRGEFEGFLEQGTIEKGLWKPVKLNTNQKFQIAANFEKIVKDNRIELIEDNRMTNTIVSVDNNLDAVETSEGHGDAFWSIALALSHEINQELAVSFINYGKVNTAPMMRAI